jgi:hypothetical protein
MLLPGNAGPYGAAEPALFAIEQICRRQLLASVDPDPANPARRAAAAPPQPGCDLRLAGGGTHAVAVAPGGGLCPCLKPSFLTTGQPALRSGDRGSRLLGVGLVSRAHIIAAAYVSLT